MTQLLRPVDFVKIVAEIARRCANDPQRLLPTMERDQNLRVMVNSALAFQHVWETKGADLARRRGYIRLPDGFRDALSDWRRRWRHAFDEPIDRAIAEMLAEVVDLPSDPAEPRPTPRDTWRLVQARGYDAEEAIEYPWLHLAQGLASAESWLENEAEFAESQEEERALEVRAGAVALKELRDHLGGWKAFGARLDAFEPVAVPLDIAAHHGATDHASLLRWIDECRRAFLFDAPMAAVSAARTALQVILRDHWVGERVNGRSRFDMTLAELINAAAEGYPDHVFADGWDHLRRFANAVVHADGRKMVDMTDYLPRLLDLMRQLVEGAPGDPGA